MKAKIHDPIVEEIHRYRAEHAKRFNYDIRAMAEDLRRRQWDSGAKVVRWDRRRKRMVEIKKPAWLKREQAAAKKPKRPKPQSAGLKENSLGQAK